MKCVDNIIKSLVRNGVIRHHFMVSVRRGKYEGVFSFDMYLRDRPYIVSENIFLELIQKASINISVNELFKEINAFIIFEENVTDRIFKELLKFAQCNDWIYLSLCHANLSESKVNVLKQIILDESLWY